MDASEVGRLLARIAELRLLAPDGGDMSTWADAMGDIRFEDALQVVTGHRDRSSQPVTPDDIVAAVSRSLEYQMGPGVPNAVGVYRRSDTVPTPPWTQEARKAAERAARACSERGLPPGHPVTERSCRRAADDVQREWESVNGRWDDVWRHWQDTASPPGGTPPTPDQPVTSEGRHVTMQVST